MVAPEDMQRVVLCSGAIYYHLSNARRQRKIRNIALVRLEQLAPFPHDLLIQVCLVFKTFPKKDFKEMADDPRDGAHPVGD